MPDILIKSWYHAVVLFPSGFIIIMIIVIIIIAIIISWFTKFLTIQQAMIIVIIAFIIISLSLLLLIMNGVGLLVAFNCSTIRFLRKWKCANKSICVTKVSTYQKGNLSEIFSCNAKCQLTY